MTDTGIRALAKRLREEGYDFVEREEAADALEALLARAEKAEAALEMIVQWSKAYPLSVFPEPDLVLARQWLAAGGITLDAVSASAMRHVVEEVGKIAKEALDDV